LAQCNELHPETFSARPAHWRRAYQLPTPGAPSLNTGILEAAFGLVCDGKAEFEYH